MNTIFSFIVEHLIWTFIIGMFLYEIIDQICDCIENRRR